MMILWWGRHSAEGRRESKGSESAKNSGKIPNEETSRKKITTGNKMGKIKSKDYVEDDFNIEDSIVDLT